MVITDLGVLEPDPRTCELVLTRVHPGADLDRIRQETGWPLRLGEPLRTTSAPTEQELTALRNLTAA
jgi:glutaconate CoA-transferase subunit B